MDGLFQELLAQEMLFPVMARGGVAGRSTVPHKAQDLLDYPPPHPRGDRLKESASGPAMLPASAAVPLAWVRR